MINLYENIDFYNYPDYKTYMTRAEEYYLSSLKRFRYLLGFNNVKFTKPFISELNSFS